MGATEAKTHRPLPAVACGAAKVDRDAARQVEIRVLVDEHAKAQVNFDYLRRLVVLHGFIFFIA
jgi:hypothetical protein